MPTRILAIDPGSRICGCAVLEAGNPFTVLLAESVVLTDSLPLRLHTLYARINDYVSRFAPDEVAVERLFAGMNPQSIFQLGHARGVAICAATSGGAPLFEYAPAAIKKGIVGYGRATKTQMQYIVRQLLSLPTTPEPDVADALACGIYHYRVRRFHGRTAQ